MVSKAVEGEVLAALLKAGSRTQEAKDGVYMRWYLTPLGVCLHGHKGEWESRCEITFSALSKSLVPELVLSEQEQRMHKELKRKKAHVET